MSKIEHYGSTEHPWPKASERHSNFCGHGAPSQVNLITGVFCTAIWGGALLLGIQMYPAGVAGEIFGIVTIITSSSLCLASVLLFLLGVKQAIFKLRDNVLQVRQQIDERSQARKTKWTAAEAKREGEQSHGVS